MVYGIVGLEVVIFYQYQTIWFGSGGDWLTLAKKTAVDMFIFSPLVSIPTAVVILDWRGQGFRFSRPKLGYFLQERLLSSMLLCWMFWIPVLLWVYSFPTNLQFPVSNLAEAAWAMVFVFFNAESA